ncbi:MULTISPECIES: DUF2742 domain-containing protein [Mycolicibacterium]|uniref:DUF2742 domain-containing protein n=1 Tax=Mycolicibacterium austroafricanum TaxID=39687 RepID=A0ABT8HPF4_MYCAO|nr:MULTISPECIES: DUF2742 domain-containing protein [Mycolicibacterium]MDN4522624.1 DUF2742 domain-containing protein [Mycolicibacterium austroafricanum]QRZ07015.1 DUF2742 domain-containing protein [Mycolicibacterium austroafricanum]QZT68501.1 DUF2742 domain-containing protein [Mycolicibacterium austroafricanum]UJL28858.1 DUF2742 domain-containing protein [Mycolicibacterium vanbaalenii]WND55571.1 DUF2742 domain-containing protein [Mycolicibacterium vanbaalenii]
MTDKKTVETRPDTIGAGSPASQEVSWWAVHQFISAVVEQVKNTTLPWAGTPAWRDLDDADPRKLLSVAIAGEHHVLRVEIGQEQRAQAAEDIWGGADWSEAARTFTRRHEIDEIRRAS